MAVYKRGKTWWVDIYAGNPLHRIRVSAHTHDESRARFVEQTMIAFSMGNISKSAAHGIIDEIDPSRSCKLLFDQVVPFYEQCLKEEKSSVTEREIKLRLNVISTFAAWAKKNTRLRSVDEVNEQVAWKFAAIYTEMGNSIKTRNNKVSMLRLVWKEFLRRGLASVNPWGVTRLARDRTQEKSGRAFTDAEVIRILAEAQKVGREWYGVAITALYTGLRRRDCETLRWSAVDLDRGMIVITPSKTEHHGIVVRVPIHPRLRQVLDDQSGKDSVYVFPFRASHDPHIKTAEDLPFTDILKAAKIESGEKDVISFHCLRHTFISRLANAGVDASVRMKLSGHTDMDTHMIYTHDDEQARAAIAALA